MKNQLPAFKSLESGQRCSAPLPRVSPVDKIPALWQAAQFLIECCEHVFHDSHLGRDILSTALKLCDSIRARVDGILVLIMHMEEHLVLPFVGG